MSDVGENFDVRVRNSLAAIDRVVNIGVLGVPGLGMNVFGPLAANSLVSNTLFTGAATFDAPPAGVAGAVYASGDGSGNFTTTSTAGAEITGMSATITAPVGSFLRVEFEANVGSLAALVAIGIELLKDGVVVKSRFVTCQAVGGFQPLALLYAEAGDGASHVWTVNAKTTNSADAANVSNSSVPLGPFLLASWIAGGALA